MDNTTATEFKIGDKVYAKGPMVSVLYIGKVEAIVPPLGTGGEWTYSIYWSGIESEGDGWRDSDLTPA